MGLISKIKSLFKSKKSMIQVGQVWVEKDDGWVGVNSNRLELVILAFNPVSEKIIVESRKDVQYDSTLKILDSKNRGNPYFIEKKYTYDTLIRDYQPTDENFLEIDVLLGGK